MNVPLGPVPGLPGDASAGQRVLLIYATPDHDSAFGYTILPVTGEDIYWPAPSDYSPAFGLSVPAGGVTPAYTPGPAMTFAPERPGASTKLVSYDNDAHPYRILGSFKMDMTRCLFGHLSCFIRGNLSARLITTDREIQVLAESGNGGAPGTAVTMDGDPYAWYKYDASYPTYDQAGTPIVTSRKVFDVELRKQVGLNFGEGRAAAAHSVAGDWQIAAFSADLLQKMVVSGLRGVPLKPDGTPNIAAQKSLLADYLRDNVGYHCPTGYSSRGMYFAFNIAGPSTKVATFEVDYTDAWGVLPGVTIDGFRISSATKAVVFPYPIWFDKTTCGGSIGTTVERAHAAAAGAIAASAIHHEPGAFSGNQVANATAVHSADTATGTGSSGRPWGATLRDAAVSLYHGVGGVVGAVESGVEHFANWMGLFNRARNAAGAVRSALPVARVAGRAALALM